MPWFYVTVEEKRVWNVGVEAESVVEAERRAIDESKKVTPDFTTKPTMTFVQEVQKYVE